MQSFFSKEIVTLVLLLALLGCGIGCSKNEENGGGANSNFSSPTTDPNENGDEGNGGDSKNPKDPDNPGDEKAVYKFDDDDGRCKDDQGVEGQNPGLVECGEVEGTSVPAQDVNTKPVKGLSIKDANVQNSNKLDFGKVADEEHRFNEGTQFEEKTRAFETLRDSHEKARRTAELNISDLNRDKSKNERTIDGLLKKIDRATNEAEKDVYLSQIEALKSENAEIEKRIDQITNKKNRHIEFREKAQDISNIQP